MSQIDRLGRDLTVWFADMAAPGTPPYLDDILRQTARVRQRPRWTFLERLLPMTVTANTSAVRRSVPWRTVGALALLILAFIVGAVLVGSTQQRLPAPFGLAEAGLVAHSVDGDIVVVDPVTNQQRTIVAGDTADQEPQWSRDGTRIVFERVDLGLSQLFTVRPDGSGLLAITPGPTVIMPDVDGPSFSFSPDGRWVLYLSESKIRLAPVDGSGVRTVETPGLDPFEVAWRPSGVPQISVIGRDRGLYLVDITGGAPKTLVPPRVGIAVGGVSWSPNGAEVAYYPWSDSADAFTVRARILNVASGQVRLVDPNGADAFWDGEAVWSNDGQRLVYVRGHTDEYGDITAAVIRADGTGRVETAHGQSLNGECCAKFEWAPNDRWILWRPVDVHSSPQAQLLIDPNTGEVKPAPWQTLSAPALQRLAP